MVIKTDIKAIGNRLIIILVLILWKGNFTYGQYITNGTFDGQIGDYPCPYNWYVCDIYSDPDIISVFQYNNMDPVYPTDGPTFIAFRARGIHYITDNPHLRCSREYLSQKLHQPIEANACFRVQIDLYYDHYNTFMDSLEPNVAYPLLLELWGGNDSCPQKDLLLTLGPVTAESWVQYSDTFCTTNTSYSQIRLQSQWDLKDIGMWDPLNTDGSPYNGEIFLDNVKLEWYCGKENDTVHHYLYYKGDDSTTLTATAHGQNYIWKPADNLLPDNTRSVVMQWFDTLQLADKFLNKYVVDVTTAAHCPETEDFEVRFNCDTLYPKQIIDTLYYKYFHPVTLNAYPVGVKYEWTPQTNLSDPDICCPALTGFDTAFSVKITDRYGCILYEYFKINALCDSLVPEKSIVVLDTTLIYNNKQVEYSNGITLKPKIGSVNDCSWSPVTGLYNFSDHCQTVQAKPISNKIYSVQVIDSFRCLHFEKFNIKVELYFPNFITPDNGDLINNCFVVYGLPERTSLKIFDKGGTLLYSVGSYDDSNCWKGTDNKGYPLGTGTYWYVLENREAGFLKKGFVFLKR
jgi:gliding motility-associated-like protein